MVTVLQSLMVIANDELEVKPDGGCPAQTPLTLDLLSANHHPSPTFATTGGKNYGNLDKIDRTLFFTVLVNFHLNKPILLNLVL
ncbi:unnamed protein product [Allacma fusca]|uniref:Uncharacterized protein n=1 Tax=Allacma fusca TaxID=39272 RepID=A0A8J2P6E7_9HEXA|nr:unnamed protein product [Allacma fusca]